MIYNLVEDTDIYKTKLNMVVLNKMFWESLLPPPKKKKKARVGVKIPDKEQYMKWSMKVDEDFLKLWRRLAERHGK